MTCDEARERMPWLWNGTLAEEERTGIEQHLESCPDCWREWEDTQWLGEAVARNRDGARRVNSSAIAAGLAVIAAGLAAIFLGAGWWNASRKAPAAAIPVAVANIRVSDVMPVEWKQRGTAAKPAIEIPPGEPVLLILAPPVIEGLHPGRLDLFRGEQALWSEPRPRRQAEGDFTVLLPSGLQPGEYDLRLYPENGSEPVAVYRITARPR